MSLFVETLVALKQFLLPMVYIQRGEGGCSLTYPIAIYNIHCRPTLLEKTGIGCYTGTITIYTYVGAACYADNIVLQAPSPSTCTTFAAYPLRFC